MKICKTDMSIPAYFKKMSQDHDGRKGGCKHCAEINWLIQNVSMKPDRQSCERWENLGKQALIHCLLCNFYYTYL